MGKTRKHKGGGIPELIYGSVLAGSAIAVLSILGRAIHSTFKHKNHPNYRSPSNTIWNNSNARPFIPNKTRKSKRRA
jgi:hypothetical protein